MVVQCPNCQSRFRVADEKVSERGVRVRCSACKTVFAVRKSPDPNAAGSEKKRATEAAPLPTRPTISAKIIPNRPAEVSSGETGSGASRLQADDLFGMSELTGESAPPRAAVPAPQTSDSIVLGRLSTPFSPGVPSSTFAPVPAAAKTPDPEPPLPAPAPEPMPEPPGPKKVHEPDPFADLSLTAPGLAAAATAAPSPDTGPTSTKTPRRIERPNAPTPIAVRKAPQEVPASARRDLVASALTGIVIAAVVLAVLRIPSISEGVVPAWLSLGAPSDLVTTGIRSGLYDTSTGKPVFFVRGKVENRGKTVRGPVRIVAELAGRSGVDARAEAVAGIEPSAEDVYALRSAGDADKLAKALAGTEGDRNIQPGSSAPFFAIIADPPADLARHKLTVRVEPAETPGAPRSAEGPR